MKNLLLFTGLAGILLFPASAALPAPSKHKAEKTPSAVQASKPAPFNVVEATIPQMRNAMETGQLSSHELVMLYLARIGMYEDKLHAVHYCKSKRLG